jgi:hypothetical protein
MRHSLSTAVAALPRTIDRTSSIPIADSGHHHHQQQQQAYKAGMSYSYDQDLALTDLLEQQQHQHQSVVAAIAGTAAADDQRLSQELVLSSLLLQQCQQQEQQLQQQPWQQEQLLAAGDREGILERELALTGLLLQQKELQLRQQEAQHNEVQRQLNACLSHLPVPQPAAAGPGVNSSQATVTGGAASIGSTTMPSFYQVQHPVGSPGSVTAPAAAAAAAAASKYNSYCTSTNSSRGLSMSAYGSSPSAIAPRAAYGSSPSPDARDRDLSEPLAQFSAEGGVYCDLPPGLSSSAPVSRHFQAVTLGGLTSISEEDLLMQLSAAGLCAEPLRQESLGSFSYSDLSSSRSGASGSSTERQSFDYPNADRLRMQRFLGNDVQGLRHSHVMGTEVNHTI